MSSFLWRLADQTLAEPAALSSGTTAMFWNPAAIARLPGMTAGVQVVRAPDIVGIDGVLAGVTRQVTSSLSLGLSFGRFDIRDIVRTTSSPIGELGSIPIYDQMAALAVGYSAGPLSVGATLRGHDSRFDIESETGITTDIGAILSVTTRLTLGASTHLQPADFDRGEMTQYLGAAKYDVGGFAFGTDSIAVSVGYGIVSSARGMVDHTIGLDLLVSNVVRISGTGVREDGSIEASWRPTIEVALVLGKYAIGVARSEGLNGLGPSYRVDFDMVLIQ